MPVIVNHIVKASPEEVAWLAGLYEGEGCLSQQQRTKHKYWVLAISMTDPDVVERACRIAGHGSFMGPMSCPSHAGFKPVYKWTVNSQQAIFAVVTAIRPLLGQRRGARADEFLADYAAREERRLFCPRGHRKPHRGAVCNPCAAVREAAKRAAKKAELQIA